MTDDTGSSLRPASLALSPQRTPGQIPTGNLEPAELQRFVYNDFVAAWDAMAKQPSDDGVGGNFMFARQAFAYLELACRTASSDATNWYLGNFAKRLGELDRYYTALPGPVPVAHSDELRLPLLAGTAQSTQLMAALFDMARHGLSHLAQQTPVKLADGKIWMLSFTGVKPAELFEEHPSTDRRDRHLDFTVSPNGHIYLLVRPDVLIADLRWSARLAAIFSQYLVPKYLERPRRSPRSRGRGSPAQVSAPYRFSSSELVESLLAGGHNSYAWPASA